MPQLDLGKVVGDPGPQGPQGLPGSPGEKGDPGQGVAAGGATNQVLVKHSGTNYDTQWVNAGDMPANVALQDAMAIVANGNSHAAIASGQFVYVRNHSSLAEGLYKATAAIATNGTLSTSNLTADASGGMNALKADIDTLNSNIDKNATWGKFTNLTLSNCDAHNDIGVKCAKYLRFVIVHIYVKSLAANSRVKIATLPTGYRPITTTQFIGSGGSSYTTKSYFVVYDNGDIYVVSEDAYAQGMFIFWES